jgi:hypothetical protein
MSGNTRHAFFFQCGDEHLFAVSLEKTGVNIPRSTCTQGWVLREEFLLGVREPVPTGISPGPILRAITDKGYYIWRSGNANRPKGTSRFSMSPATGVRPRGRK